MGAGPLEEVGPLIDAPRPPAIRAFFGLPLPEAQRRLMSAHLADCAAGAPGFRWVEPAGLHLTLRFIGRVDPAVALQIGERLVARRLSTLRLELGERGTFGRGRMVRVVWAGLRSGEKDATRLATQVEAECAAAGLAPETRPFAPHLTLGRARQRDGAVLPELPPIPSLEAWTADELVLYRSHLGSAGARYEPLVRVRLAPSG